MLPLLLPVIGSAVVFLLYLALAAAAIRRYKHTGDKRFLWLLAGIVGWLVVARLLNWGWDVLLTRSLLGHSTGFFPFSLLQSGHFSPDMLLVLVTLLQHVVGLVVLLAILVSFSKKQSRAQVTA